MRPRCLRSGQEKRSYASQAAAIRAAAGFAARGDRRANYNAYECSCGRWHLTTLDRRQLREIRKGVA
ncbi:MAG TPA: hypothetical protein VJU58_04005 [Microbacterium sp.]|nr:hypothetical protein [Microbacterium sp.]